jgi:hypothetical protein
LIITLVVKAAETLGSTVPMVAKENKTPALAAHLVVVRKDKMLSQTRPT